MIDRLAKAGQRCLFCRMKIYRSSKGVYGNKNEKCCSVPLLTLQRNLLFQKSNQGVNGNYYKRLTKFVAKFELFLLGLSESRF